MKIDSRAIKFYGVNDLGAGYHLKKVETLLETFNANEPAVDINQCLEMYNGKKYIDVELRMAYWTDETFRSYKEKCKRIPAMIGKFLRTVDGTNLLQLYEKINGLYRDDFWELICEYKLHERIGEDALDELLTQHPSALWCMLRQKKLVLVHGEILSKYLETNPHTAERLIDHYLAKHDEHQRMSYFPREFAQEKRDQCLQRYVEADEVHLNYLELLWQAQSTGEFPVSDKLRLKAKKRHEAELEKWFSENRGVPYGVKIGFGSRPDYSTDESFDDRIYHAVYSREWLTENLDYPTLLNNFIYLFGYVDRCFRCSFVSLKSKNGVFERVLGVKGCKDYPKGIAFDMVRMCTASQMQAYTQELERQDIQLENVFQWFFETYLKEEFGAVGFSYNPPSVNTTPEEKCKLLASAIDGVLKQYRLFCEDGYVDRELLEISSGHVVFSELKSLIEKKYAYSNSDDLLYEQHMLYSDQSLVMYTEKTESRYAELPKMLLAEDMLLGDFYEYQQRDIQWLIERGTVIQNTTGKLTINREKAAILRDLFMNEVICPSYYNGLNACLKTMVESGDMIYECTLFSRPEQAYLNYVLNKSEYSNGLDLRNKYSHDTCPQKKGVQVHDYAEFLKIMVLIIIKINEEFCLRDLHNREE